MSIDGQPGFMYWLDIGFFVLSLTLTGCGGPASPHGDAYCGDGHPPAGTCCRAVGAGGLGRGNLW